MGKYNDSQKAETILKRGLSVEELRDRADVLERLMNFYDEEGRTEDADKVAKELDELLKNKKPLPQKNIQQIASMKVGGTILAPVAAGRSKKNAAADSLTKYVR